MPQQSLMYPSFIMAGGRLQERVRGWVRQRTLERGDRARLAAHLRRPRAWATKYVNGRVDADIDTLAALADYFAVPLATLLAPLPLPRASHDDAEDRALLELWRRVPPRERPILRDIIELYARGAATTRSAPSRAPARPARARGTARTR